MVNRCGSTYTRTSKPCKRRVKHSGNNCWQHTFWALLFRQGSPEPRPSAARSSAKASGRDDGSDHEHRTAAKVGKRVNTVFWRRRVSKHAQRAVDHSTWVIFTNSDAAASCKTLASIAQQIDNAKHEVENQLAKLAVVAMRNNSVIAKKVADAVAKKIVSTVGLKVVIIVRSLRVLGVFVCAQAGRDLGKCRCLRALLKAEAPRIVKQQLRTGLKEIAAEYLPIA
jgi:hypothetical protein